MHEQRTIDLQETFLKLTTQPVIQVPPPALPAIAALNFETQQTQQSTLQYRTCLIPFSLLSSRNSLQSTFTLLGNQILHPKSNKF